MLGADFVDLAASGVTFGVIRFAKFFENHLPPAPVTLKSGHGNKTLESRKSVSGRKLSRGNSHCRKVSAAWQSQGGDNASMGRDSVARLLRVAGPKSCGSRSGRHSSDFRTVSISLIAFACFLGFANISEITLAAGRCGFFAVALNENKHVLVRLP